MKFDDPIRSSAFECLVFPAAGGVPLSAMATAGVIVMPPRKTANGKRRSKNASKRSKPPRIALLILLVLAALLGDANLASSVRAAPVSGDTMAKTQIGIASWYGAREAGHKTASGTIFDPSYPTAAHRTLPLGTCVRVTDLRNSRFVIVPVTDRGPYIPGRLIDLSENAAQTLDMKTSGLARVRVDVVSSCLSYVKSRPPTRPELS